MDLYQGRPRSTASYKGALESNASYALSWRWRTISEVLHLSLAIHALEAQGDHKRMIGAAAVGRALAVSSKEAAKQSELREYEGVVSTVLATIWIGMLKACVPVSYTHLTLPTKRIV